MKKYILLGLILLLIVGCQKEVPIEEEEVIVEEPTTPTGAVIAETAILKMFEVQILGRNGFDPDVLTVKVGDGIIFINNDPREKAAVITFKKDNLQKFINTELIQPGDGYQMTFEEAGTYNYWTIGYGVRAKLIVQE